MSRRYTQTRHDNRLAKRAVKACHDVLVHRVKLGKLINCGAQGCVYEREGEVAFDSRHMRRKAEAVVKVSAGRALPEIEQIMWQKLRGWRSHVALPRVRKVYHLNRCAKRAGISTAYVTIREDLRNIPSTPAVRKAVRLLERLEDDLFDAHGTYDAARRVLRDFEVRHHAALREVHRSPLAWRVFTHIAGLQVWLASHGLTMSDVKVANLGARVPSLQRGEPYDVVMRDIGCLQLRTQAPTRERQRFRNGPRRVERLGLMP
jgi:hypothetical protein